MNRRKENPTEITFTELSRGLKLSPATIAREIEGLPLTVIKKGMKVKAIPVREVGMITLRLMESGKLKKHQS